MGANSARGLRQVIAKSAALWLVVAWITVLPGRAMLCAQTRPSRLAATQPARDEPIFGVEGEAKWVGPDQRIWSFRQALRAAMLPDIKQEIAQQFTSEKPLLTRSNIVLFEPGGRVWFSALPLVQVSPGRFGSPMLLGYDGRNWIERPIGVVLYGWPDRPVLTSNNHVFVDGRAFFSIAHEVHEFDGLAWKVHVVAEPEPATQRTGFVHLMLEPSGNGLIAVALNPAKKQVPQIRRWDGMRFIRMGIPNDQSSLGIRSVSPGARGVWILTTQTLVLMPYNTLDQPDIQGITGAHLGLYMARSVMQMHSDYLGRTFFLLQGMTRGADAEDAILMEDRDGQFLPLRHPGAAARCNSAFAIDPTPVLPVPGTGGELVWLPGNHFTVGPLLLDTRQGRVLHECPYFEASRLLGATRDGLLLTGGVPYSINSTPPAQRPVWQLTDPKAPTTVTASGQIVSNVSDRLCILEQGRWRLLLSQRGLEWPYCRGRNDGLLVTMPKASSGVFTLRAALTMDGKAVYAESLRQLLEQHQSMFARCFANSALTWDGPGGRMPRICVNAVGDVFMAEAPGNCLSILHQGEWIDPSKELDQAGVQIESIQLLTPVGDGSVVYVSGVTMDPATPSGARISMKDGKVIVEPAAGTVLGDGPSAPLNGLRDSQGGLWFLQETPYEHPQPGNVELARMTEGGVRTYPAAHPGTPCLLDTHGCLIMRTTIRGAAGVYVVKDGKLTTRGIHLAGSQYAKYLEIRPGLIWAATRSVIHELEETNTGSGEYALRESFRPALDLWEPESIDILSDGKIAIRGVQDRRTADDWRLYALPAPKP